MTPELDLIPWPRKLVLEPGATAFLPSDPGRLRFHGVRDDDDRFAAQLVSQTLRSLGSDGFGEANSPLDGRPAEIIFEAARPRAPDDGSYRLTLERHRITIAAGGASGRYYGAQTLRQLILSRGWRLPCLRVEDAPDFRFRGFLHDVSRGKVPRRRTLEELVAWLGFLKINHLQLYIEHPFAFARHPLIGRGHSPLTPADIRALDQVCRRHHVQLVPNLQSFGHAARLLALPRYRHLAESGFRGGWTLSPAESGTYRLLDELYGDFLPHFSSGPYFNVDCDETWDLGRGKSAARARAVGVGRVYLDHILRVRQLAARHGRRIQIWGDILARHPELIGELPDDVVLLNWDYEARPEADYRRRLEPAAEAGLEHWVCPGTSSWNSLFFRRSNARGNLQGLASAGRTTGALGYLITDWGDNGHYNFLSFSHWSLAYGAERAWRTRPPRTADRRFDRRFARLFLADPEGRWVEPIERLGELYRDFGVVIPNNSAERWLLTGPPAAGKDRLAVSRELRRYNAITRKGLDRAVESAEIALAGIELIEPPRASLRRLAGEWRLGARLAAHACRRALRLNYGLGDRRLLLQEIETLKDEFRGRWLERNRRSDLAETLRDFDEIRRGYASSRLRRLRF